MKLFKNRFNSQNFDRYISTIKSQLREKTVLHFIQLANEFREERFYD